ncbi:spindle and kinetochore-associated protein 2 [Eucalyptus grandis]|uniref:spindle and kinetochore-associated protein 2 n=1 Tax=Eucalyptus grandis TaxID=71139 RepID=UPI00192EE136|nr:spindle and kinetochore-associated protein 2 [Eucalyptus grandis]
MAPDHHRHHQVHHHASADQLVNLFRKSDHDLTVIHHRLEREFRQIYPDDANPLKLVSRIKKVLDDVSSLKDQCQELLVAKQDLIDQARTTLVGNRSLIRKMQASVSIPLTSDSEDPAYANFNQIIDEWTKQVQSASGSEQHVADTKDLNKLLFSAIVQSS